MKTAILTLAAALAIAGCGGPAPGQVEVWIWGEDFIEQGIPASAFSDGWSVKYSRFLMMVGDVTVAQEGQPQALLSSRYGLFELTSKTKGQGQIVSFDRVQGGLYDYLHFRVAPRPKDSFRVNLGIADASADEVAAKGCSLLAGGEAKNEMDGRTKKFNWCFPTATRYGACQANALVDGGDAKTQITIHGDHLFYDDLFSSTPNTAFELIARADSDNDGDVTEAELRAVDLSKELRYQVGSTKITNLWDFIAYQTGSLGHVDGEGHCATMRE